MKKCLIVYDSYHHGNTKKLAAAMAESSGAELCSADQVGGRDLSPYEVIGFGSGIAYGSHYEKLKNAVRGLRLTGKTVFVFSTSGTGGRAYNAALLSLLKDAGASVAGDFACKGFDTFGPFKLIGGISKGHPDDKDLSAAREFVKRLVS